MAFSRRSAEPSGQSSMLSRTVLEPILAGVAGAVIDGMFVEDEGFSGEIETPIGIFPTPLIAGLAVGLSSALGEVLKNYAAPKYDWVTSLGMLAKPAFTGASNVGVTTLLSAGTMNVNAAGRAFAVGAAAEIVGSYGYGVVGPILENTTAR
jgi:hypothetical protein